MFLLVLALVIIAIATNTPWLLLAVPALWLLTTPLRYRRRWAGRHWAGRRWAC